MFNGAFIIITINMINPMSKNYSPKINPMNFIISSIINKL